MNVKVGDLAYQTYEGTSCGRVYEVLSINCDHLRWGRVWNVRCANPLQTFDPHTDAPVAFSTDFQCPDDWLRPISGVPVDDEVIEDLREPA